MNRSYGPASSRYPSANTDRYEDWRRQQPGIDTEFHGAEPWQSNPDEDLPYRTGAMDRQPRRGPNREDYCGNRQVGENEAGGQGRFGEGEMGGSGAPLVCGKLQVRSCPCEIQAGV